ncbi:uncharacterized protein LOC122638827 [Telopea speciosissima]|uniref:uncharacterized protein LOC122638827 n=1 Tax=Telopea speciosissima TaxID=54955 RepID=UPI001CC7DB04|nr:uncharacterized protein LOC122638827 [Telopea speciosissima]
MANGLTQATSSVSFSKGEVEKVFIIQKKTFSSVLEEGAFEVGNLDEVQLDWRSSVIHYLQNPDARVDRKTRYHVLNYLLHGNELYKRGQDDLLLKSLGLNESMLIMAEDYIKYVKGCQACQRHVPMQGVPATQLHPIVNPWSFRGWALDLIEKVTPPSAQGHVFVIVATDNFTKWVEAVPMKLVSQADVIRYVRHELIHHFGLPETLTCDNGLVFSGGEVSQFTREYGITVTFSIPYYAQRNGQAKASNKVIKVNLSKVINDNPRSWAEMLSEVLWSFMTSKRMVMGMAPYALTFGYDAILPMEVTVKSLRVARHYEMTPSQYKDSMMAELDDLDEERLLALDRVQAQKAKVAKAYNKMVRPKAFTESDLVFKAVFRSDTRTPNLGSGHPPGKDRLWCIRS